MKQVNIDAEHNTNINSATKKQYDKVISDFYLNQRSSQIAYLIKKGISFSDAQDIFYSVIEYLVDPKTYQKYLSKGYGYFEHKSGLSKIGFGKFVIQVIRTKIFNFSRGQKRKKIGTMAFEANTDIKHFSDELNLTSKNANSFKTKNEISIGLNNFSQDTNDLNFQKNLALDPEQIMIRAEEKSINPILRVVKNINYRSLINIKTKTQFAA